jgi:uncharacterized protein
MNKLDHNHAVIVDTSHSPYARLKPIALGKIRLDKGFWLDRYHNIQENTIPSQYRLLEETGRLDNFRRVVGEVQKPFQGYVFNDSDVYKWLEAACWSLQYEQSERFSDWIDQVIALIIPAQDRDGYINTYFSLDKIRERWTNLLEKHELYCAGHLIQAAIAHHRVTGSYRFLNVALRLADHIYMTFGPSQVEATPGHPEIELALIELYRTTNETKYLKQAEIFINRRGHGLLGGQEYYIDQLPLREMNILVGHAVRGLYLCSGAADLALETGESQLSDALDRLWNSMVNEQIYLTGGIGSRYEGEAFGLPYELPNARAYSETCASIASLMWNWRMLQFQGKARYADLLEWTLYNAILPGISLNGFEYFYVNPLKDSGNHRRQTWFDCACCPPNISRTLAMLPGYMYSTSDEGIWLHLYGSSQVEYVHSSGHVFSIKQMTTYPWDGHILIEVSENISSNLSDHQAINSADFSLFLRIPAWVGNQDISLLINGKPIKQSIVPGSYLKIHRKWKSGDKVELNLTMQVQFIESHPSVLENKSRVAITRGPLVYCLETADNPDVQFTQVRIEPLSQSEAEFIPDLLSGIIKLHLMGRLMPLDHTWETHLYRLFTPTQRKYRGSAIRLTAIPYYAWANRQPGEMEIWHQSV